MLYRPVIDIKVLGPEVFMGFKTGDTEMFHWDEVEKELYRLVSDKVDEHEYEL